MWYDAAPIGKRDPAVGARVAAAILRVERKASLWLPPLPTSFTLRRVHFGSAGERVSGVASTSPLLRLPEDVKLSMELVKNIHSGLPLPESEFDVHRLSMIRGDYLYYHYGCDGKDDCGWGCGYRTMQTLSSWIILQQTNRNDHRVPTLREVQEALVEMEDKPPSFVNSKTWIGSFEIALCIDKFHDVPCKLVHVRKGGELLQKIDELHSHFDTLGSPVMMGGDSDSASKGILGVFTGSEHHYLLILDPHYSGKTLDKEYAQRKGWVAWKKLDLFDQNSFYNFCLPQWKGV